MYLYGSYKFTAHAILHQHKTCNHTHHTPLDSIAVRTRLLSLPPCPTEPRACEMGALTNCPEYNRTLPNVPRNRGDVITRGSQHHSFLEKLKEKNMYHWNHFMDSSLFSSLVPTKIVSMECDSVQKGGVPTMRCFDCSDLMSSKAGVP